MCICSIFSDKMHIKAMANGFTLRYKPKKNNPFNRHFYIGYAIYSRSDRYT